MTIARIRATANNVVAYLEDERIPLSHYVMGFGFIIVMRNFLECFSSNVNYLNIPSYWLADAMVHFALSYIALAMMLTLLVAYATRESINHALRIVLPGFGLIILSPLLDIIMSKGQGVTLTYLRPDFSLRELIYSYFTLFGGIKDISLGIRTEIALALIGLFAYFQIKKLSLIEAICYVVLSYTLIYLWAGSPIFINGIESIFGIEFVYTSTLMSRFYLLEIAIFASFIAYFASPAYTTAFVKDSRLLRIMHYELMFLLGVTLALVSSQYAIWPQLFFNPSLIVIWLLAMIAIVCVCWYAIVNNNLADVAIDQISNPERPLVTHKIDEYLYRQIGIWMLAMAMLYAIMVNADAWLMITVFAAAYFLYSTPPFRLKRVFILSKLTISFNSLVLIMLGYLLVHKSMNDFPRVLYPILLIGYTLGANFIDLKDVQGDRAAGIKTLPLYFGARITRVFMGIISFLTTVSFYFLAPNIYFLPVMIAAGAIQFYLITRDPYQEKMVLGFYNVCMIIFIMYLLIMKSYF